MHVAVDDPRHHHAALQIEDLRPLPDELLRAAVTADEHDAAVADRDGAGLRVGWLDGPDEAVHQDEVGSLGATGEGGHAAREDESTGSGDTSAKRSRRLTVPADEGGGFFLMQRLRHHAGDREA